MSEGENPKRKLVDITLEEAAMVAQLGEGYLGDVQVLLRVKEDPLGKEFAQLYYIHDERDIIVANFFDTKDAVRLVVGNKYYRTFYRIIKYLEGRGFDLESADSIS